MDDVAGKTRRNLLAFASAISAVGILDIPLDGKLIGAVDISAVNPSAAWGLALMVLLYLHLRYLFEPKTRRARTWLARKRREAYEESLTKELQRAIKRPFWSTSFTNFSLEKNDGPPKAGAVYCVIPGRSISQNRLDKRCDYLLYAWYEPYAKYPAYDESLRPLEAGLYGRLEVCRGYAGLLWCWSCLTAIKPSWSMLEHFIPLVVTLGAYGIAIAHLWAEYSRSFPAIFRCIRCLSV